MPFQGNPNAGAPDPALINMLFQQKQRREELAWEREKYQIEAQRQAQLDAAEESRKAETARLDKLKTVAELQIKLRDFGPAIDESRRNVEAKQTPFTSEDLFADGGGEDFASVVGGLDPNADPNRVRESDFAKANLASQLRQGASILNEVDPLANPAATLFGAGQAVETQRDRKAELAKGVKLDDEQRALKRTIDTEKRGIENAVTQAGLVAEEGQLARVRAGDTLINLRSGLRARIAEATKKGKDTTILEERLGLLNGRIRALADPNSHRQVSSMPAAQRIQTIREYRGASAGLTRTIELGQALDDGKIRAGISGAVENFKLRAVGMLENIARLDPNIDQNVRDAIQGAIGEGSTTVTFTTDAGKQLTLGLDQIQLAYDMARNGRGGGARFTIREIESFMKEFAFTSPFTTEDQIRGALTKVAKQLGQEKATASEIYRIFGEDVSELQGEEIFPDDLQLIEGLGSGGPPRGSVDLGTSGAAGSFSDPAVADSTLDAIRAEMNGGTNAQP